jgi:hypothetical protein
VISRKVRIEGNANQTSFSRLIDLQGNKRSSQQRIVLYDADQTALLRNKNTAVRSKGYGRRALYYGGHQYLRKARWISLAVNGITTD